MARTAARQSPAATAGVLAGNGGVPPEQDPAAPQPGGLCTFPLFHIAGITVLRVNDSRCQPGTQCIRAGEIQARVLVAEKGRFRLLTLQFPEARNTPWAGLRMSAATFDRLPKLTFTDGRE